MMSPCRNAADQGDANDVNVPWRLVKRPTKNSYSFLQKDYVDDYG